MNKIILNSLKLKTFTEQNAEDYCQINNINPDNIIELYLYNNELTDISGIRLLKNLKELDLGHNQIGDISVIQYLNKLKYLNIRNNKIKNIFFVKDLSNLKSLGISYNKIKDISVIQSLNKLKKLSINNLELELDQIQYIKSLKNLELLLCKDGFKNMFVLNQLNNIEIIK